MPAYGRINVIWYNADDVFYCRHQAQGNVSGFYSLVNDINLHIHTSPRRLPDGAHFTLRRRGKLMRKVFEFLLENPNGLRAKDVIRRLSKSVRLNEFEKGTYPSQPGRHRIDKMIRFATILTTKAGWMRKDKGTWFVTP